VLGCCTTLYVTLWILHVSHEPNLLPFVGCSQGFWLKDLCSNPVLPCAKDYLNGCLQWNLWRMAPNRRQLRANSHFAWLTNVPKLFGHKVCRVIVNRYYERHKEIRSLGIHSVVWSIRRTIETHRAPGEQKSCCRIFSGNFWLTGSSVGIATDYGLDGLGSNPGGDEIFRPSRLFLGPTQPPVQWVTGLSQG